ncbi:uncharacterized protein K460DRAFT_13508 [Cucurbitaria berberidis CBS 394.84]|uniref:Secreted protein n=1 Tax=Cucurbitaria berberidis CBS 394.84 TaxID=1168544 RepID=A0A9P4GRP3_9PLEO|nr:uncharacterized protein K460DRAFT_13508 [Cucurbitaria berberidis CBS 394.84]KAF1850289.1 hypothetical protein K460DRAFT_13508 [Cucurbitaria berberidis CBS 394.84]
MLIMYRIILLSTITLLLSIPLSPLLSSSLTMHLFYLAPFPYSVYMIPHMTYEKAATGNYPSSPFPITLHMTSLLTMSTSSRSECQPFLKLYAYLHRLRKANASGRQLPAK